MKQPAPIDRLQHLPSNFRFREALALGVDSRRLRIWQKNGQVELLARGLYRKTDAPALVDEDLFVVAHKIPQAVLCLISALQFHRLGTQIPHKVQIALPRGTWVPVLEHPPLEVFRFSGASWSEGIEEYQMEGSLLRVYSPAKTVADCFKLRSRLGLDIALEALRDWRSKAEFDVEEQLAEARHCRVEAVMRPYLEAML
jgi:predicted transcriptional regulator of viral defense system